MEKNKIYFIMLIAFFLVLTINTVNAQIVIKSVETTPLIIKPGEIAEIKLVIWNTGNERINDINVKLDLTNLPLAPSESSTEQNIERIYSDDTDMVIFRILVLPTADSMVYKIPVQITHNQTKKDSIISLDVQGKPDLTVAIEENKAEVIGTNGEVTIRLVNKGLGNIKFLNVKLLPSDSFDIISSDNSYVGDLKSGDTDSVSFKIRPNTKDLNLVLNLDYKDQNNNDYYSTKSLELRVYSREEAINLGILQKNNSIYYFAATILVVAYFILRARFKKKKKAG